MNVYEGCCFCWGLLSILMVQLVSNDLLGAFPGEDFTDIFLGDLWKDFLGVVWGKSRELLIGIEFFSHMSKSRENLSKI